MNTHTPSHTIFIWACRPVPPSHPRFSAIFERLSSEERQELARIRHHDRRAHWAASRALRRVEIARLFAVEESTVIFEADPLGRPLLIAPDRDWSVSQSHTPDAIAFATSPCPRVGVDIERLDRADEVETVIERVLHPDELRRLKTLDGLARSARLISVWVLKEAISKSLGLGLRLDFTSFALEWDRNQSDEIALTGALEGQQIWCGLARPSKHHIMAIACTGEPEGPPRLIFPHTSPLLPPLSNTSAASTNQGLAIP
ncbi:MAG: 4'-phosphopantetheinyl transferase superfamily protein [Rhodobacteraceae bacterium]|nr:4'-phosphopantetheinyl transferase superfamily protein [Paracoccaceae bacterium]